MDLHCTCVWASSLQIDMESESNEQQHAPEGDLGRSISFHALGCAHVLPDFHSGHLFNLQSCEHRSLARQICAHESMNVPRRGDEDRQACQDEGRS